MSHADAAAEMKRIKHQTGFDLLESLNSPVEAMITMKVDDTFTYNSLWRNPVLASSGVAKGLYKFTLFN